MQFQFQRVAIRGLGVFLPTESVSSEEIENRLGVLYRRLNLVPGRLELMTGIRSRRHFPKGTLPSDIAVGAAEDLFSRVPEARSRVDCLIHAAVCRNFLEPATAAVVHRQLGLSDSCLLFDLSNACLSWMNALVMAGGMIESGQCKTALVVSGEDAGRVVEATIRQLNEDQTVTRQSLKPSLASLTLGSGGTAALLTRPEGNGARLLGGAFQSATRFHGLCEGGVGSESTVDGALMSTDSETMLHEGVALAARTWSETRDVLRWAPDDLKAYYTHQVGSAHRRLMIERLELDPAKEFSTYESLGNVGAASVGITFTLGARAKALRTGEGIALLGIGSGLVCGMLGLEWNEGVSR